jgi:hypothetical protein
MTIGLPLSAETFEAEIEADESGVLMLYADAARSTRRSTRAAVLRIGWRIVSASPAEQALLEAHGFGSGRVQ